MEIIAIDTGNKNIKTTLAEPFNAGLVKHGSHEPPIMVDTLCFEGQYYSLTESRTPYLYDKTENETYYMLTLIAIARQLIEKYPNKEFYKYDICLALGLPPAHLTHLRNKYMTYFKRRGNVQNFTYNNIPFEISIKDVQVWAQGFAAICSLDKSGKPYLDKMKNYLRSYIVDIGGYTTDVIRLNRGVPDMDFCESFESGAIHMFNKVASRIRVECQANVDDYVIDSLLRGSEHLYPDLEKVANQAAADYAESLIQSLKEKGLDFEHSFVVFIGGGVQLMDKALTSAVPSNNFLLIPNINANAKGYERLSALSIAANGE